MAEDHIQKAREAGQRAVARLRKAGVIPEITAKSSSAIPKIKWADATADQKLEYLCNVTNQGERLRRNSKLRGIARAYRDITNGWKTMVGASLWRYQKEWNDVLWEGARQRAL